MLTPLQPGHPRHIPQCNHVGAGVYSRLFLLENLFVLMTAISTVVLKLLGQELLSVAAGFAVCILVLLYWVCYLVLKKKY